MRLEANHVSFRYDRRGPWVLRDVSLTVERGERVALFAPSGYGKTTLALLLAGYLQPTEGQILLDGRPLPRKGVCPVQLIYQHPEKAINPRWRLRQVLEESGQLREDMLDAFGIERAWLDRFPRELSGGELQRFCVARALMSGADFLICDEISTMLDVITQAQIWEVVLAEAARRDMGLIAVTHNRHLADRICTRGLDLRPRGGGEGLSRPPCSTRAAQSSSAPPARRKSSGRRRLQLFPAPPRETTVFADRALHLSENRLSWG